MTKIEYLTEAMEMVGLYYDPFGSDDEMLRFTTDYGISLYMNGWDSVREYLADLIIDDPDILAQVKLLLHPERESMSDRLKREACHAESKKFSEKT